MLRKDYYKNKPSSTPDLAKRSLNFMDLTTMKESMMRLNRNHYEVLVLICIQGMRYDEVAELLSIPVETIRARLSAARQQLHNFMQISEELQTTY